MARNLVSHWISFYKDKLWYTNMGSCTKWDDWKQWYIKISLAFCFLPKIRYKLNRFNIFQAPRYIQPALIKHIRLVWTWEQKQFGRNNIYIWNSIYYMKDNYDSWFVSSHSAGLSLFKKFYWKLQQPLAIYQILQKWMACTCITPLIRRV